MVKSVKSLSRKVILDLVRNRKDVFRRLSVQTDNERFPPRNRSREFIVNEMQQASVIYCTQEGNEKAEQILILKQNLLVSITVLKWYSVTMKLH